jgi:hypothetical protein
MSNGPETRQLIEWRPAYGKRVGSIVLSHRARRLGQYGVRSFNGLTR